MIGTARTGILVASLCGLLAIAVTFGLRSNSGKPRLERSAELTGSYQELKFAGTIQIDENGAECLYKIPGLTISFLDTYRPFPSSIQLEQFRIVVVPPGMASDPKAQYLLERRDPLLTLLSSSAREFRVPPIAFAVPKNLMRDAEYLALAVVGRMLRLDRKYDNLDPIERDKMIAEARRVLWPMAVTSNVISVKTDPNGEHGSIVYRTPSDPNDACSSAKIR